MSPPRPCDHTWRISLLSRPWNVRWRCTKCALLTPRLRPDGTSKEQA